MTEELKACPFCGSKAETKPDVSQRTLEGAMTNRIARCTQTGCYGRFFDCNEKMWNTRPIESALQAQLKASRDRVGELEDGLASQEVLLMAVEAHAKMIKPVHGEGDNRKAHIMNLVTGAYDKIKSLLDKGALASRDG